jgi:hypothetical protein
MEVLVVVATLVLFSYFGSLVKRIKKKEEDTFQPS